MRLLPRAAALTCLMLLASGCPGADPPAETRASGSPPAAPPRALAPKGVPKAVMSSGTSFQRGLVVRSCVGDRCERADVRPERFLEQAERPLLTFAMSARPVRATVRILNASREQVSTGTPAPGTTMAFAYELPRGRYFVSLTASWPSRETEWLFGLRVRRTRDD